MQKVAKKAGRAQSHARTQSALHPQRPCSLDERRTRLGMIVGCLVLKGCLVRWSDWIASSARIRRLRRRASRRRRKSRRKSRRTKRANQKLKHKIKIYTLVGTKMFPLTGQRLTLWKLFWNKYKLVWLGKRSEMPAIVTWGVSVLAIAAFNGWHRLRWHFSLTSPPSWGRTIIIVGLAGKRLRRRGRRWWSALSWRVGKAYKMWVRLVAIKKTVIGKDRWTRSKTNVLAGQH